MKKLLRKFTGWLVQKTNYTPAMPLPIQPIIIKPEDLKKTLYWLEERAKQEPH